MVQIGHFYAKISIVRLNRCLTLQIVDAKCASLVRLAEIHSSLNYEPRAYADWCKLNWKCWKFSPATMRKLDLASNKRSVLSSQTVGTVSSRNRFRGVRKRVQDEMPNISICRTG